MNDLILSQHLELFWKAQSFEEKKEVLKSLLDSASAFNENPSYYQSHFSRAKNISDLAKIHGQIIRSVLASKP
jgi:hypothetical protein